MTANGSKEVRDWRNVAEEAAKETDSIKLDLLVEELCAALDERERLLKDGRERDSAGLLNKADWKSACNEVLRESDPSKLFKLVEIAEAAIRSRLDALDGVPNHGERQSLEYSLDRLRLLKEERLKFGEV